MTNKTFFYGLVMLISGLIPCFAQSPVNILDYAVYATEARCSAIRLSGNSYTDSFDSSGGGYALTKQDTGGNLFAAGSVELQGSAIVNGTISVVDANTRKCRDHARAASVSGGAVATEGERHVNTALFAPSPAAVAPGSQDYHFTSDAVLAPGSYHDIVVSASRLTLLPGAYMINSIKLKGDSVLALGSAGQVIINVAGIDARKAVDFSRGVISNASMVPDNFQLIYGGHDDVILAGGALSYAVVYAPDAPVVLDGRLDWYGTMVVGSLTVSDGAAIHYDRHLRLTRAPMSITAPTSNPDTIFANTPTTVMVTAHVSADPRLDPTSISLIRLRADGKPIGVLGRLYDDGTHGDPLAGDGTFTGQFSFTAQCVGATEGALDAQADLFDGVLPDDDTHSDELSDRRTSPCRSLVRLAVTATYKGSPIPAGSQIFSVSGVRQPTDAEVQTTLSIQQNADQLFQAMRTQVGDDNARRAVVSFLLQQSGVSGAGVSVDNRTVWVTYSSGINGVILGNPPGTQGTSEGSLPLAAMALGLSWNACSRQPYLFPFLQTANIQDPVSFPGSGRGIVLAPFFDVFSPFDASQSVANDLSLVCGAGSVSPMENTSVTVDAMKSLNQYGLIHINTHGGVDGGGQVIILTRESALNIVFHLLDALLGRVELSGSFLAVTPAFFRHYAGGGFQQSIVFASACETLGTDQSQNSTLSDAFVGNGAAAYFGYRNTVHTDFNTSTTEALYGVLANPALNASQRTTGASFSSLASTVDPTPNSDGTHGTLLLVGNNDVALSGNPIVNGGFETGDFSGWTVGFTPGGVPTFPYNGPDGPYASIVAEQHVDGNYAARLGRWDEPYMGGGALNGPPQPGAEPGGTDWVFQDVQLPASPSLTLQFSYNVATFDAVIFDYFYAQLLDPTSGGVIATLLPPTGPNPGPDYGFFSTTGWQSFSFDLTPYAGRRVRLWFGNHQDGYGDQTAVYLDQVAISCR